METVVALLPFSWWLTAIFLLSYGLLRMYLGRPPRYFFSIAMLVCAVLVGGGILLAYITPFEGDLGFNTAGLITVLFIIPNVAFAVVALVVAKVVTWGLRQGQPTAQEPVRHP